MNVVLHSDIIGSARKKKTLTNFATVKIGASCKSNLVVDPFQISLDEGVISNCPEILLQFTLYLK